MGYGFKVTCRCQSKGVMIGCGLNYPEVYQKTVKDVRAGKYGVEMQKVMNENELATVDADSKMYQCPDCGNVECMLCLDIYRPKDLHKAKETVMKNWSAAEQPMNKKLREIGDWPYWCAALDNREGDFECVMHYDHQCPRCQKMMREISEEKIQERVCPKCKQRYQVSDRILWD